jgi:SAM-dependent methyltransferase
VQATDSRKEAELVAARYERRSQQNRSSLYNPLDPAVYMTVQERERALIRWIAAAGMSPVGTKSVLEIGCGSGSNLLTLMHLGFSPERMVANELLPDRAREARLRLPQAIHVVQGDALECDLGGERFDVVLQSTVFSSLLDDGFQQRLADRMWSLVQPGGGVLWYDFIYNNPSNPDVRGVSVSRIRTLFPNGNLTMWRVTLAPPISRRVTRIRPSLYAVFNALPFLRTHVLCWIRKEAK